MHQVIIRTITGSNTILTLILLVWSKWRIDFCRLAVEGLCTRLILPSPPPLPHLSHWRSPIFLLFWRFNWILFECHWLRSRWTPHHQKFQQLWVHTRKPWWGMKRNITFNSQIKQTGKYKGQCSYCGSSNRRQNGTKLWDEFANAKNKTNDGGAKEAPFDTKSCWKRRPKNDLR